jgi:hypothetical protein
MSELAKLLLEYEENSVPSASQYQGTKYFMQHLNRCAFSKDKRKPVNFSTSLSDQEDSHGPTTENLPICTRSKTQKLRSVRVVDNPEFRAEIMIMLSFTAEAYCIPRRQ